MRIASVVLLTALLAAACTPPNLPPAAPTPAVVDLDLLRSRLTALPGAEVTGEPPVVRYPGESLFAEGAVLPLPGGTAVLEPLAEAIAASPGLRWRGTVRAAAGPTADDDRALAAGRAEVLTRYFLRRGIGGDRLRLEPEAGPGAPLELAVEAPQPASSASSSRENR